MLVDLQQMTECLVYELGLPVGLRVEAIAWAKLDGQIQLELFQKYMSIVSQSKLIDIESPWFLTKEWIIFSAVLCDVAAFRFWIKCAILVALFVTFRKQLNFTITRLK